MTRSIDDVNPAMWRIRRAPPKEEHSQSHALLLPMPEGELDLSVSTTAIKSVMKISSPTEKRMPEYANDLKQALENFRQAHPKVLLLH